jgi:hypothetical protein
MPVPPSQSVGGRLDSWKEIAEYLRRDLRTVRRWEKTRDLPIRRVPGGGRSAVYAFRREIDTWLLDTSSILDVSPQNDNSGDLPRQLTEDFGGTEATVSRLKLQSSLHVIVPEPNDSHLCSNSQRLSA